MGAWIIKAGTVTFPTMDNPGPRHNHLPIVTPAAIRMRLVVLPPDGNMPDITPLQRPSMIPRRHFG